MLKCNNSIIFLNFILFLLFIFRKCLNVEDASCKRWKWIIKKMKQLIISIILLIFLFFLIIYSLLSKLHLMHFTAALICFYNYSYSSYFHDHGAFNFISFIMELWANKEKNSKIINKISFEISNKVLILKKKTNLLVKNR